MLSVNKLISDVFHFAQHFFREHVLSEMQLIFCNFVGFNVNFMVKTSFEGIESLGRSGHVNTCNLDVVTWRALSGYWSSAHNSHLPWNVTNWNLIGWFLELQFLKTDELAGFDLENQLALNHILDTLDTWAFNQGSKCLLVDNLVNFAPTCITSIVCNLNAGLDIVASGNDSLDCNQRAHLVCFNLSHLREPVFAVFTWHNAQVIASLKLWWNLLFGFGISLVSIGSHESLGDHGTLVSLRIKSPLLHHDVMSCHILLGDVNAWLRHVFVNNLGEQLDVSVGVVLDSLNETVVFCRVKEFFDVL